MDTYERLMAYNRLLPRNLRTKYSVRDILRAQCVRLEKLDKTEEHQPKGTLDGYLSLLQKEKSMEIKKKDNNCVYIVGQFMYSVFRNTFQMLKLQAPEEYGMTYDTLMSVVENQCLSKEDRRYEYCEILFIDSEEVVLGSIMLNCSHLPIKETQRKQDAMQGEKLVVRINIDKPNFEIICHKTIFQKLKSLEMTQSR